MGQRAAADDPTQSSGQSSWSPASLLRSSLGRRASQGSGTARGGCLVGWALVCSVRDRIQSGRTACFLFQQFCWFALSPHRLVGSNQGATACRWRAPFPQTGMDRPIVELLRGGHCFLFLWSQQGCCSAADTVPLLLGWPGNPGRSGSDVGVYATTTTTTNHAASPQRIPGVQNHNGLRKRCLCRFANC